MSRGMHVRILSSHFQLMYVFYLLVLFSYTTGYKDWIEQAMANSDDPEATLRRIKKFQKFNSIRGTAIMVIAGALGIWYNSANPYVPPGH